MEHPPPFGLDLRRDDRKLLIAPSGELDLATVPRLDAELPVLESGLRVVLDLRNVAFLDTTGMRFVLALNDRAQDAGADLRVIRGPRAVQRIFEIAGLEEELPFVDEPPG